MPQDSDTPVRDRLSGDTVVRGPFVGVDICPGKTNVWVDICPDYMSLKKPGVETCWVWAQGAQTQQASVLPNRIRLAC